MIDSYFNQVVTAFRLISSTVQFDGRSKFPLNFHFARSGNRGLSPLSNGWLADTAKLPIPFGARNNVPRPATPTSSRPVQRNANTSISSHGAPTSKPNNTGLPDQLKSGIEALSGMAMDHVKVHYNSSQPAQLNAHAYAQGNEIHVAPGQERHLPHEAWHVVQQAQGRVKPTMQMKSKSAPQAGGPVQRNALAYAQGSNIHVGPGQQQHLPHEAWHTVQQAQGRVKPTAQLNAHAYAQGSHIHIAPGQEKHLPHEAWHVVQQRQLQLKSTLQRKQGVAINDDATLEKEADIMGARAIAIPTQAQTIRPQSPQIPIPIQRKFSGGVPVNDDVSLEHEADLMGAKALSVGSNVIQRAAVLNGPNPTAKLLSAAIQSLPENRNLQRVLQRGSKVIFDRNSNVRVEATNAAMLLLELAPELHWAAYNEIEKPSKQGTPVLDLCAQWLCNDASIKRDSRNQKSAISKEDLVGYLKEPCGYMVLYVSLERA